MHMRGCIGITFYMYRSSEEGDKRFSFVTLENEGASLLTDHLTDEHARISFFKSMCWDSVCEGSVKNEPIWYLWCLYCFVLLIFYFIAIHHYHYKH